MIRLNVEKVHYLDVQLLQRFSDLELVSESGACVGLNALTLAAFDHGYLSGILKQFEPDDGQPTKVITEFQKAELDMVADFCMQGLLPLPLQEMKKEVPTTVEKVFSSFGIDLRNVLFNKNLPKPGSNSSSVVKIEAIDIKPEIHDTLFDDYFDDYPEEDTKHDLMLGQAYSSKKKAAKRKVGRPRKKRSKSSEDEDDDTWTPAGKNTPKDDDDEYFEDENGSSPSKKKPKVTKVRKTMVENFRQAAKDFQDIVKIQMPNEDGTMDKKKLEVYALAQPQDYYIKPPRPLQNTELMDELNRDKPVGCDKCQRRFVNEKHLDDHDLKFHANHFDCPYCIRAFRLENFEGFRKHMFRHEHVIQVTDPHECIQCGYSAHRLDLIRKHVRGGGPFHNNQCTQCQEKFECYADYKCHVEKEHLGVWKFKCGLCEKLFDAKEEIKSHRMRVHNAKNGRARGGGGDNRKKDDAGPKVCDVCGKEVINLTLHRRSHHESANVNASVACPECGKMYKSNVSLSHHIMNCHDKSPCSMCGKLISKKRASRHFQQHHMSNADKKYKCKFCGKGFVEGQRLRDHVHTHTGEKPYVCKFCGQAFASVGNHRMHERGHLGHKRSK